ncbi:MAG: DUF3943 domain-containing protein [Gammaproteobacteria bacterium]|nr:DUF3943 domain-containing protein [Gammaproteobacteria bacterium]
MTRPETSATKKASAALWAIVCLPYMSDTHAAQADMRTHAGQSLQEYDSNLEQMIDCPLWLDSLKSCVNGAAESSEHLSVLMSAGEGDTGGDWKGIKRDTYYFLGLQMSIIGVLYFMPESVSSWSDEQREQHRLSKWWDNVSGPEWDEDDHYINYVLHPYWGAAYYVRARERGYGRREAFWYSFLLSTMYEAGIEALFEPVSIQDFFVTPIVGAWLGGYFMDWRHSTRQRMADTGEARFRDKALLVLTDPLGNTADFIDRRLGRDVSFTAAPFVRHQPLWSTPPGHRTANGEYQTTYGVTATIRW